MIEAVLEGLINEKYGTDKFLFGCETVTQWLNFETHGSYAPGFIIDICKQEIPESVLSQEEDNALRKLLIRDG